MRPWCSAVNRLLRCEHADAEVLCHRPFLCQPLCQLLSASQGLYLLSFLLKRYIRYIRLGIYPRTHAHMCIAHARDARGHARTHACAAVRYLMYLLYLWPLPLPFRRGQRRGQKLRAAGFCPCKWWRSLRKCYAGEVLSVKRPLC